MADRSGGYRPSGREMLSYGFKMGEPWADDRRELERAFREQDAQSDTGRSHRTSESTNMHVWSGIRMGPDFDGGDAYNTMSSSRSGGSAAYLYQSSRNAGGADYGEAPGRNQSSNAHSGRTTSGHGFTRSGIIDSPRHEGESGWIAGTRSYSYSNRHSWYDEYVSSRPRPAWRNDGWRDSAAYDDDHSRWDGDSDSDGDSHEGDGSVGGMYDQEIWLGSPEYYHDQYAEYDSEYDIDSEGDYDEEESGYIGSEDEVYETESESGSEYYSVGSSGDEESYASESDVASDVFDDAYFSDSD